MKKLLLTITIILGMTLAATAEGGGFFGRGQEINYGGNYRDGESQQGFVGLPGSHGTGTDQAAPLGGGVLLLIGFGAAYALKKKRDAL